MRLILLVFAIALVLVLLRALLLTRGQGGPDR